MQSAVQTPDDTDRRRTLCLGGSFNPIHVGHLICARAAAEAARFDRVRLIPTAQNPHKSAADLAAAADRLTMCQLAVAGDPFFIVDDREMRRTGPSYTFDTAAALEQESGRVTWLIGTDLLPRLQSWHRFDELVERVDFQVMRRAGHSITTAGLDARAAALAQRAIVVPSIQISATTLRERARAGLSLDHWVPPAVARFIANAGLYREQAAHPPDDQ